MLSVEQTPIDGYERRYTVAVLRPGTRDVMAYHKLSAEVAAGLQFDPQWWGEQPASGKRLIQVIRVLDPAEWPQSERGAAGNPNFSVVETEWV